MRLSFEDPIWLALAILALPLGVIALRWFSAMSRMRRWSAIFARTILFLLLAGALAGAAAIRQSDRLALVAVIDISDSVRRISDYARSEDGEPLDALSVAHNYIRALGRLRGAKDLLGVVVFDGRAAAVAMPAMGELGPVSLDNQMVEGTNLGDALRLGAAIIPPDAAGRLLLISDGNQTEGDVEQVAAELAAGGATVGADHGQTAIGRRDGIRIDAAIISYGLENEVLVEQVDAPGTASPGSVITVRVVLNSTGPVEGELTLLREGEPVPIGPDGSPRRRLVLDGGVHVELVQVPLDDGRIHRFRAIFEPIRVPGGGAMPPDAVAANNAAEAFTLSPGKGAILLVDGVEGGSPALAEALQGQDLEVTQIAPGAMPLDLLALQPYDLVILQNVGAYDVPTATQEALVAHVTQLGAGLIMVGGPESFGAGGWKQSAVEPILPVLLDLPERMITPPAAVMIVLDSSGSMGYPVMGSTRSQQQIANEGAALAVLSMGPNDLVGVISFDSAYRVEVPLGPNDDPAAAATIIRSISSGGGTDLPPALREAHRQMAAVEADAKHVIVLSDGASQDAHVLPSIAEQMRADGITVSTIAVGDQAEASNLSEVASAGGGTYYPVRNPTVLPRLFVRAVRVVSTPLIREKRFSPLVLPTGSPIIEGLGPPPPLNGLVLTQARSDPTVINAMASPDGEPVLSHWNAGVGRVAAFTSDAHDWAEDWLAWEGYPRFWAQMARTIARPPSDQSSEMIVQTGTEMDPGAGGSGAEGDGIRVQVNIADREGNPLDRLTVPALVYAPDGSRQEIRLVQTAPGQYEGSVRPSGSGPYVIAATPRLGPRALAPVIGGVTVPAGAEHRSLRSNDALMREVARIGNGRIVDLNAPPPDLFAREGLLPRIARSSLWQVLLAWALAVFVLDAATRRIAWDRLLSREFGASLRREAAAAMADRTGQVQQAIGRLRERSTSVREEADTGPGAAPAAGRLSTEDALAIVREQAKRRREQRATERAGNGPAGKPPPIEVKRQEADGDAADAEGTSGLLAAKRRARERFEREQREAHGGESS